MHTSDLFRGFVLNAYESNPLIRTYRFNQRFFYVQLDNWEELTLKRYISFLLISVIILIMAQPVFAANEVLVRIITGPGGSYEGWITPSKPDALSALKTFASSKNLSVQTKDTTYGPYVISVAGLAEKKISASSGWGFWVNAQSPEVGADQTSINNGDEIVWSIYDYSSTLYPIVDFSPKQAVYQPGQIVTIHTSATKTMYDENWNASTSIVTIPDAMVSINQNDQSFIQLKTDATGSAQITIPTGAPLHVTVEKYDPSNGLPLLVKSRTLTLPIQFDGSKISDIKSTFWAYPCIIRNAARGWLPLKKNQTFAPNEPVSFAELTDAFSVLFKNAPISKWLATANYKSSFQTVTRQQMAVILNEVLTSTPTLNSKFPVLQPVNSNWRDQKSISSTALTAVQAIANRAIINGYADRTYHPNQAITRAEFVHVLRMIDDVQQ